MKYSVNKLLEQSAENLDFIFFWGHRASKVLTQTCFSQWWAKHPFEVNGVVYATAEHWMMAHKARLFNDVYHEKLILADPSPAKAKAFGRKVNGWDYQIWDEHKLEIVVEGNVHKFQQHADLRAFLLGTGNKILVEASPKDYIWGIGLAESDPRARLPAQWLGENLLGFALMEVRDRLRCV